MFRLKILFLLFTGVIGTYLVWIQYPYIQFQNLNRLLLEKQRLEEPSMDVDIKDKVESDFEINLHTFYYNTTNELRSVTESLLEKTTLEDKQMKNILIWTNPHREPIDTLLLGQEAFIKRKCEIKNCFIRRNDKISKELTEFDVILFHWPDLMNVKNPKLPARRSPHQKYVYISMESADYYPVCDQRFNGYFNITWTYKLNSDIFFGYVIVRNSEGMVIGPKQEMHWMHIDDMKPINETVKHKLNSKTKLAAWLVSNCNAPSGRDQFVKNVQSELKKLGSNMTVDVYGACGTISCNRNEMTRCLRTIETDYHFYFSFENSFAEDYVTEKLLHSLQHYSIPVVYGHANYTRFMPDGMYLNARDLGPANLAKRMLEIANDKELFYSYFKWLNHYSFHYLQESPETDPLCQFCAAMNDVKLMGTTRVIENIVDWWNPEKIRRGACPRRH